MDERGDGRLFWSRRSDKKTHTPCIVKCQTIGYRSYRCNTNPAVVPVAGQLSVGQSHRMRIRYFTFYPSGVQSTMLKISISFMLHRNKDVYVTANFVNTIYLFYSTANSHLAEFVILHDTQGASCHPAAAVLLLYGAHSTRHQSTDNNLNGSCYWYR
jgi:hypothetical protein